MRLALAFLTLISLGCASKPQPQETCGFVLNSEGQRVSWKNTQKVDFYADPTVPLNLQISIARAADTWNHAIGRTLIVVSQSSQSHPIQWDGVNTIYYDTNWQGSDHREGECHWDANYNRITESDIVINAKNFSYTSNTPYWWEIDFESLILHEMGHALGLDHTEINSVMAPTLAQGVVRRTLSSVDESNIKCEY